MRDQLVERDAQVKRNEEANFKLQGELDAAAIRCNDLAETIVQMESALSEMTAELESMRASRDRALDAAVNIRRALDERLNTGDGES